LIESNTLVLTGDTDRSGPITVWASPGVEAITWNGLPVTTAPDGAGGLTVDLPGPVAQPLPVLTGWRTADESASTAVRHDDSTWPVADRRTTTNPNPPPSGGVVLFADDYGFHHGDIWYRGHFTATGAEQGIELSAGTGNAGVFSVWLNGTFLGSGGVPAGTWPVPVATGGFGIPVGLSRPGEDNVIAVLVRNMGHNQTYGDNAFKEARGLIEVALTGSTAGLTWRIQGNAGGQDLVDPVRGPVNNGGLFGERAGWSLPGFPDQGWEPTALPATQQPGVAWYRTTFEYHPLAGQDTSVALRYTDDPARHYRALLFVNGWNLGQYINDVGPQRDFVIPNGILVEGGNTIAIASWAADASGGLGEVSLVELGTVAGGLSVAPVASPGYDALHHGSGQVRQN
jgi:hypothetical protein